MDIVTFNQLTKHAKLHKLNPIRLISPTVTEEQHNQANKIPTWNVVRNGC
jgi:tryptophan synthase alpha subunit